MLGGGGGSVAIGRYIRVILWEMVVGIYVDVYL